MPVRLAGGRESGLSPSSHPAFSAPCGAENLSAAAEYRPDSSACFHPLHPSASTHLPALIRLFPSASRAGLSSFLRYASSTQDRKWVACKCLWINENVNLKCRNLHFEFSIFLNYNELPATRFSARGYSVMEIATSVAVAPCPRAAAIPENIPFCSQIDFTTHLTRNVICWRSMDYVLILSSEYDMMNR